MPLEDRQPDEDSDSDYEYTFYDDDDSNMPYIPISESIVKTQHVVQPMQSEQETEDFVDDDDDDDEDQDAAMGPNFTPFKPKPKKTAPLAPVPGGVQETALELNWSDDECIEEYESDAKAAADADDDEAKTEGNGKIAWFPEQRAAEANVDDPPAQEMKYDKSAYNVLFEFYSEWPCLSFDILRDTLGAVRTAVPYSLYLVTGSQADPNYRNDAASAQFRSASRVNTRIENRLQLLKLNEVHKTKYAAGGLLDTLNSPSLLFNSLS